MTGIWAHRGFSYKAPENTMAAFQKAIECGSEGIETDIHLTRDNVLVITHDPVLGRTVEGKEAINQLTWKELKTRDNGSWFSNAFSGERVPRLEDLLDLLESTDLALNLEIKEGPSQYPGLVSQLLALLDRHPMRNKVILSSFDLENLMQIRKENQTIPMGFLNKKLLLYPAGKVRKLQAQAYHPDYRLILPGHCRYLKKRNIQLNPYTVDKANDIRRLLRMGVNNIISNKPDLALSIRNSL